MFLVHIKGVVSELAGFVLLIVLLEEQDGVRTEYETARCGLLGAEQLRQNCQAKIYFHISINTPNNSTQSTALTVNLLAGDYAFQMRIATIRAAEEELTAYWARQNSA